MNKQEIKVCQECQQEINDNKHYSVILEKNIFLCPNCWGLKKNDYKEKLKEKWQQEITKLYQSSGQNQNVDKNSSDVVERIHALKTEEDGQNNFSTEFGICFGCDEWNETGKEHGKSCQDKAAEKKELEHEYQFQSSSKNKSSNNNSISREREREREQFL